MCHAVARPLSAEYWHIGEMTMRFCSVRLRSLNGVNSALTGSPKIEFLWSIAAGNAQVRGIRARARVSSLHDATHVLDLRARRLSSAGRTSAGAISGKKRMSLCDMNVGHHVVSEGAGGLSP